MESEGQLWLISDDDALQRALANLIARLALQLVCFPSISNIMDVPAITFPKCVLLDLQKCDSSEQFMQDARRKIAKPIPIIAIISNNAILSGVKSINNGAVDFIEVPIDENLMEMMLKMVLEFQENSLDFARIDRVFSRLTRREMDILRISTYNQSITSIAKLLHINRRTVSSDKFRINKKLGTANFAEASKLANHFELSAFVSLNHPIDIRAILKSAPLDQIAAFIAVAEAGGLRNAEEILKRSKKDIVDAIRALEIQIDQKMFQRVGAHIRLTSQGKAILPFAKAYLISIQELSDRIGG